MAQVQAAAQVQNNAQQVQLQQQQLEAQSANYQTAASLSANNTNTAAQLAATLAQISASVQENQTNVAAQTADTANQYVYAENMQSMQDQVLTSQINSSVLENANNNATALAGLESSNDLQAQANQLQAIIANHGIDAGLALSTLQETDYDTLATYIAQNAGKPFNTANDANRATTLYSQILAGGNPAPVIINQQGQTQQNIASTQATGTLLNTIAAGLLGIGAKATKAA